MKLSSCKYKFGGVPRKKMVGGQHLARGDQMSSGVKKAMAAKGAHREEEKHHVEGEHPKPRLDRPGRKHGGKIEHRKHKADGGEADGYGKGKDDSAPHARIVPQSEIDALRKKYDLDAHPEYDSIGPDGKAYNSRDKADERTKLASGGRTEHHKHHEDRREKHAHGGRAPMHLKLKEGALHKELGVKEGEKIPAKKLDNAMHSDDEKTRKRAQFAENAKHFKKS